MKGHHGIKAKFKAVGASSLYISEITLAELKFGIAKSQYPQKSKDTLAHFLAEIQLVPIIHSLDVFASEKARLQKAGRTVDDFDLLIGATAIVHNMVLVTNNTKHFDRFKNIMLENWARP